MTSPQHTPSSSASRSSRSRRSTPGRSILAYGARPPPPRLQILDPHLAVAQPKLSRLHTCEVGDCFIFWLQRLQNVFAQCDPSPSDSKAGYRDQGILQMMRCQQQYYVVFLCGYRSSSECCHLVSRLKIRTAKKCRICSR